jgi:hypothetical protein
MNVKQSKAGIVLALLHLGGVIAYSSRSSSKYSDAYGTNFFVDTYNNYYDGYQQAWRYLGWYVKCGSPSDRYNEDEERSHHSKDDNEQRWQGNNYCQRYLIWAAVSPCSEAYIVFHVSPSKRYSHTIATSFPFLVCR